jgi:hypothetical protein
MEKANQRVLTFRVAAFESATDICDGSARQRSSVGTVDIGQEGEL